MRPAWLALAAVLVAPRLAQAEPKAHEPLFSAAMEYAVPPGCPSRDDFVAIVLGRLGFDPFVENAPDHVLVSIEAGPRNLTGRLEWRDAAGRWAGDHTFPAHTTDCAELVRTMGFALAVQINLLAAGRPDEAFGQGPAAPADAQSGAPPAGAGATRAAAPKPGSTSDGGLEPETREEREREPWTFALGAGGALAVGMSPSVLGLGRVFGSAGRGRWSFELGGELSTRAVERRDDGAGYAQELLLASAAACGSERFASLCLLAKGGVVKVSGRSIDVPAASSGMAFQTGLRLQARQRVGRVVFVAERVEGLFNLMRWSVELDQVAVWSAPVVAGSFGLDVGAVFD